MPRLSDISNAATVDLIGNASLAKAVLAINAASAATVKTTTALLYTVNGVMYTKAILSAQAITPTHTQNGAVSGGSYVQPVSTTVYYTLSANAAGTIAVTQGTFAGQDLSLMNAGASVRGDGSVPDAPDLYTPFGVIKVVTNASTTFTAGTTALDAAGLTVSYFDVAVLPAGAL